MTLAKPDLQHDIDTQSLMGSTIQESFASMLAKAIRIKKELDSTKWGKQGLAAMSLGISNSYLNEMLNGKAWPSNLFLEKLAETFGWDLYQIQAVVTRERREYQLSKVERGGEDNTSKPSIRLVSDITDSRRVYALRRQLFYCSLTSAQELSSGKRGIYRTLNLYGEQGCGLSSIAIAISEAINGNVASPRQEPIAFDVSLEETFLAFRLVSLLRATKKSPSGDPFKQFECELSDSDVNHCVEIIAEDILAHVKFEGKHFGMGIEELTGWLADHGSARPLLVLRRAKTGRVIEQLINRIIQVDGVRLVVATEDVIRKSSVMSTHVGELDPEEIRAVGQELTPTLTVADAARRAIAAMSIGIDHLAILLSGIRFTKIKATGQTLDSAILDLVLPGDELKRDEGADDKASEQPRKINCISVDDLTLINTYREEMSPAIRNAMLPTTERTVIFLWAFSLLTEDPENHILAPVLALACMFEGKFRCESICEMARHFGMEFSKDNVNAALRRLVALGWIIWRASEGNLWGVRNALRQDLRQLLQSESITVQYVSDHCNDTPKILSCVQLQEAFIGWICERIKPVKQSSGWAHTTLLRNEEANMLSAAMYAHNHFTSKTCQDARSTYCEPFCETEICSNNIADNLLMIVEHLCILYTTENAFKKLIYICKDLKARYGGINRYLDAKFEPINRFMAVAYLRTNDFKNAIDCFKSNPNSGDYLMVKGINSHLTSGASSVEEDLNRAVRAFSTLYNSVTHENDRERHLHDIVHATYWKFRIWTVLNCRIDEPDSFEEAWNRLNLAISFTSNAQNATYLTLLHLWGARIAFFRAIVVLDSKLSSQYRHDMQRHLIAARNFLFDANDRRAISHHRFLWTLLKLLESKDPTSASLREVAEHHLEATNDDYWKTLYRLMLSYLYQKRGRATEAKQILADAVGNCNKLMQDVEKNNLVGQPPCLMVSVMNALIDTAPDNSDLKNIILAWTTGVPCQMPTPCPDRPVNKITVVIPRPKRFTIPPRRSKS